MVFQRAEQFTRAGQRNYSLRVFDFSAQDDVVFFFYVGSRNKLANGGDAGTSVRATDGFFGIQTVLDGPACPNARNRWSGVNQNSIKIKEKSATGNFNHD
jgi:hypothetical protein